MVSFDYYQISSDFSFIKHLWATVSESYRQLPREWSLKHVLEFLAKFTGRHLGLGLFSINFHTVFFHGSGLIKSSIVTCSEKKTWALFCFEVFDSSVRGWKTHSSKDADLQIILLKFWESFSRPNNIYNYYGWLQQWLLGRWKSSHWEVF